MPENMDRQRYHSQENSTDKVFKIPRTAIKDSTDCDCDLVSRRQEGMHPAQSALIHEAHAALHMLALFTSRPDHIKVCSDCTHLTGHDTSQILPHA